MFTIKHKGFTISAVVSLIILLVVVTLYDCYLLGQPDNIHVRFVLKPIPVSIMILNVFVYFAIYRMHVYAILIGGALLFCLLGDILLMFYVPSILEYDNILFLIVGGISFFIARGIMSLAFGVYPYRNNKEKCIDTNIKKTVLIGLIVFVYTVGMIVYLDISIKGDLIMKIVIPIYIIAMGVQLFVSLLRIRGFKEETLKAQLLGVFGTLLFTVSDTMLLWNIFISVIPYGDAISITLYWGGLYLIMISIVRSETYETEKSVITRYLPLNAGIN